MSDPNKPRIIGQVLFTDGAGRDVYQDADGRQYVRDDDGAPVYAFTGRG